MQCGVWTACAKNPKGPLSEVKPYKGLRTMYILRCMQGINATVEIIETVKSKVDLDKIINIKGFQLEKVLEIDPNFLDVSVCPSVGFPLPR